MDNTKQFIGQVVFVEDNGEWEGKKKWRVVMRNDADDTMKIDILDFKKTGVCPLKEGPEQLTIEYTDRIVDGKNGKQTYHNYVWPGGEGGWAKKGGGGAWKTVKITLAKAMPGNTTLTAEVSLPIDEVEVAAVRVCEAFEAVLRARTNQLAGVKQPVSSGTALKPGGDGQADESPF